ncbi:MAG: folylpolyglutamate synthase/dihydrofolate synthase family protein, partial [Eubacteriales bacterium]|nr:folylpolyglutamate synthase/dihydrofolate synthase family protein [Eubacteriales bacterium]
RQVTNSSQQIIDKIHESTAMKGPLGLDRMRRLLSLLGNPEKDLQIFHVAGTNGKGSVATYLSSILQEAGYTVGVHTSPHVMVYNERFVINNRLISDEAFVRYGSAVLSYNEWLNQEGYGYLSEFEILTAIAYLFFADNHVDYMISEVGLGGVIDSTNTIEHPLATIITQVGKDHTAILGNTLREIAWNKAGIIKPGVPVISESLEDEVQNLIRWKAEQKEAPFTDVSEFDYKVVENRPEMVFNVTMGEKVYSGLHLSMQGNHQVRNAITALAALQAVEQNGMVCLSEENIRNGLQKARIMGRFEFLQNQNPAVIIDGGHNPSGVASAMEALKQYYGEELESQKLLIVFGCFKDKEYDEMAEELAKAPANAEFIITEPHSERALSSDVLAKQMEESGFHVSAIPDEREAYTTAVNGCYDVVLFIGSIYLIGDIRILYQTKGW